jgi:hypothetical protein
MQVKSSMAAAKRVTARLILDDFFTTATIAGSTASNNRVSIATENSGILGVGLGVGLDIESLNVLVAEGEELLGIESVVDAGCAAADAEGDMVGCSLGVAVGGFGVSVGVGVGVADGVAIGLFVGEVVYVGFGVGDSDRVGVGVCEGVGVGVGVGVIVCG